MTAKWSFRNTIDEAENPAGNGAKNSVVPALALQIYKQIGNEIPKKFLNNNISPDVYKFGLKTVTRNLLSLAMQSLRVFYRHKCPAWRSSTRPPLHYVSVAFACF